jgi:D-arabinose 1-dehydrogenase-like Zn-dependent alcohol dehydrogenase
VCRSDWHAWKGHDPVTVPHVGGHEFAGTVVAVGPLVARWKAGDRVTVPFACGCGRCESADVAAASVRCLRRRGRHVQVGLLLDGRVPLPMGVVIARELEIYGSHGMAARDYPPMMTMIADGTLRPGLLIGDVIGLEDTGRALAAMDASAGTGMTVVRLEGVEGVEGVEGLEG